MAALDDGTLARRDARCVSTPSRCQRTAFLDPPEGDVLAAQRRRYRSGRDLALCGGADRAPSSAANRCRTSLIAPGRVLEPLTLVILLPAAAIRAIAAAIGSITTAM